MRVPISYALHYPERADVPVAPSTWPTSARSPSSAVDPDAFPCLRLAREAAAAGGTAPCVLNAANEVAVHAFLDGRLRFLGIAEVIERDARAAGAGAASTRSSRSTTPTREARAPAAELVERRGAPHELAPHLRSASPLLIVLHEFGHFAAAKPAGMRVERFALFFPPLLFKVAPRRDRVRRSARSRSAAT